MQARAFVFRVDATPEMGAGHLMRCQALAHGLSDFGIETHFVCMFSSQQFVSQLNDAIGHFHFIPDSQRPGTEVQWLVEQAFWPNAMAVLVDGYHFNHSYRQELRKQIKTRQLMLWDDLNDGGPLDVDIVINTSEASYNLGYELTAAKATHFLGRQFHPLRPEFYRLAPMSWSERQDMTVIMGGTDPLELTLPVIETLQSLMDAAAKLFNQIHVITTEQYPNRAAIESHCRTIGDKIRLYTNPDNLADLFNRSRLVISAAGGTQFELLHCHCPSILLIVAGNQEPATRRASEQGWCKVINARQSSFRSSLRSTLAMLMQKPLMLEKMCAQAKSQSGVNKAGVLAAEIAMRLGG